MNYPDGPTSEAQIDSTDYDSVLLGENELGSVYVHGPFGNVESDVKIAYLIGMHPLESKSHRALFEKLIARNDLNYCYYLYNINVLDKTSDSEGRDEGQFLAQEFVQKDIISKNYDLFLDIHSNRGPDGPGDYIITNFLFAPGFDDESIEFMEKILAEIEEIVYYAPEFRSSPAFITEPTAKAGIPTLVYECYSSEPFDFTLKLAEKLISVVDNLF
ncbi:adhesin [uncultured Methanobrevibacter sp.]|uniref:adhesin n=1 Tax=uncultured Methanobrevibacter sp. TaxID=253161 RepID=UPI0025DA5121|nr:adhesin [uncultured Methanobrevibacter sp.]MCI6994445.1 adhesin [Methanobrevibacter sp.]